MPAPRRGSCNGAVTKRIIALAVTQSLAIGWVLHFVYLPQAGVLHGSASSHHGGAATEQPLSPLLHYLRDTALSLPVAILVVAATVLLLRKVWRRETGAVVVFAVTLATAFAVAAVPEVLAHAVLFDEHVEGVSLRTHLSGVSLVTLRYTFALAIGWALLLGLPLRVADGNKSQVPISVGEITLRLPPRRGSPYR